MIAPLTPNPFQQFIINQIDLMRSEDYFGVRIRDNLSVAQYYEELGTITARMPRRSGTTTLVALIEQMYQPVFIVTDYRESELLRREYQIKRNVFKVSNDPFGDPDTEECFKEVSQFRGINYDNSIVIITGFTPITSARIKKTLIEYLFVHPDIFVII